MEVFRTLGKGLGTAGGGLIGGTVKAGGKIVGTKWKGAGEWIEDVGDGVQNASKIALENAGQFIDGTAQGTYGAIKKDDYYKQKGLNNLKESAGKTVKGIGSTVKYTAHNASASYKGFRSGNSEQAAAGLKNIGKVVAVSGLAIGFIDLIDHVDTVEAENVETRNAHLNGLEHPETGVSFVEKAVQMPNGQVIEGTFPVFDEAFTVVIAEELYTESDMVHFQTANETLYKAIAEDPSVAENVRLTPSDLQALENGQTPAGYTWHHSEEPGHLQLVDRETHAETAHTGGRALWGGGEEFR